MNNKSTQQRQVTSSTRRSKAGGFYSLTADSLGRLQDATTHAEATSFVISNAYNSTTGFLDTVTYPTSTSAVAGSRFKVQYEYAAGLLKRARDFNTPATIYWEQIATNAAGQTIDEQYGNGLHTYSSYDGMTGLIGSRTAGASSQVQNLTYQWDKVGNLKQRKDNNLALTEDFNYDNLYRLDDSKLNGVTNLDMSYNALGNITSKSDVGSYTYPASGTSSVRPHAVTAAGSNSFVYDANGNMISRNASAVTWTSYNLPNRIDKGSNYSQFFYGASRDRYKQIAVTAAGGSLPAGTETTLYLGGLYEKVTKPSGVIEHKHYLMAGKEAIAIRTLRSNSVNDTRYLHKDHLGSVDTITNEAGAVVQRLSYDAFGKRRNATAWAGALTAGDWTSIAAITHRAFTFHEQLDNVDLVHMNGRVYDPNLGRFISADPFIQAPLLSQSLNRYSYVMNNPLSLIDPSGYSWLSKAWKKLGRAFGKIIKAIGQVVASVVVVVVVAAVCFYSWEEGGCGPAIVQGAAWLSAIWGPGGGGGGPSNSQRGPPSIFLPRGSPPPMTAPPGAVALTPTLQEAWSNVKNLLYGAPSTPYTIIFRDPSQRAETTQSGANALDAVITATKSAYSILADSQGKLPGSVRGVLIRVTEGGSGWDQGTSEYHTPRLNQSTITIHMADVLTVDQATLNSIMLHELMHTVQDSKGGPYGDQSPGERMRREQEAYGIQWSNREDVRFSPNHNLLGTIIHCRANPTQCYE